jgi:hypothetical protein
MPASMRLGNRQRALPLIKCLVRCLHGAPGMPGLLRGGGVVVGVVASCVGGAGGTGCQPHLPNPLHLPDPPAIPLSNLSERCGGISLQDPEETRRNKRNMVRTLRTCNHTEHCNNRALLEHYWSTTRALLEHYSYDKYKSGTESPVLAEGQRLHPAQLVESTYPGETINLAKLGSCA